MLTFAIPKGRILEPLVALLVEGGVKEAQGLLNLERDLVLSARSFDLRFLIVRDRDVPTYIAGGGCDLGVVGSDVLMEQSPDLYELMDLQVGACSLKLAEPQELAETDDPSIWTRVCVATKYPRITQRFFRERGVEWKLFSAERICRACSHRGACAQDRGFGFDGHDAQAARACARDRHHGMLC